MGKVYDGNGNSCMGVTVILRDGERGSELLSVTSDVTGGFYFPAVPRGTYSADAVKKGFHGASLDFECSLAEQTLYFRIFNGEQLLSAAESRIEEEDYSGAGKILDDLSLMKTKDDEVAFLRAIILWREGNHSDARALLEPLLGNKGGEPYIGYFYGMLGNDGE